eukprot:TRINITY_DN103857_c0_g1_i1.p1 TRINITY_DN103857_c0_g1~~TRINITY_DN103857_c0_g1_i1.p1  ORF type:complete len:1148 (-),score=186.84 TRINITY_DN103857_c0_g1_i1:129-3341(-)
MDVTVEFETMQHSSLASTLLENLLVGKIDTDQDDNLKDWGLREPPAYPLLQPSKKVSRKLTGGLKPGTSPASTDVQSSQGDLWSVEDRGFLPAHDPVKDLPKPWKALVDVIEVLPALVAEYTFCDYLEKYVRDTLPTTEQEVDQSLRALSEGALEALHSCLGYICLAYVRSPPDIYHDGIVLGTQSDNQGDNQGYDSATKLLGRPPDEEVLPLWLARPWIMCSNLLKRRPMLDYAGCVLNNWERINPEGPISPSNVRLLRRFTGLADEEWFFKTHIIIESEGSHVVSALGSISEAVASDDTTSLLQELHALEEAMWRVSSVCLPIMYARSQSNQALLCEPFMFFFRLRPYIKSLNLSFQQDETLTEKWMLHGPSGAMSSILPCVDSVLGIKNSSSALRETVKAFESYVPEAHRSFMSQLYNSELSVKSYIRSKKNVLEDTTWYALAGAFNAVLARVLDFRWRHLNFVHNFIVRPASGLGSISGSACPMAAQGSSAADNGRNDPTPMKTHSMEGTGGTSFDYLQQHISDSQEARFDLTLATDHHKSRAESYTASVDTPRMTTPMQTEADPASDVQIFGEANFWEPRPDCNGFLANRKATMPRWANEAEAPLPGCAALQRLVWNIPGDCVESKCIWSSREIHPFINKCDAAQPQLEALVQKDKDGYMAVARLPIAEIELAWLLLVSVASAYRVAATQVNAGPAIHPDFLLEGDVCPALRQGRARKDAVPCAAGKTFQGSQQLPSWLRSVVASMSSVVKRPAKPAPEYCEVTLNNWRLAAEYEDEAEGFQVSIDTVHKIRPIVRFIGLPDEDWYRKLHTVLEAEGGRAIATAQKAMSSAIKNRDNVAVATALNALGQHIEKMNDFQRQEFDQKDSRGEAIMMQRLLPFLAPYLTHEECAVWIYTEGSSPLLPSLHAFLGLTNMERIPGALQEHWQVERVADLTSMPVQHLDFLDTLTRGGTSVRAYCLKEWRHSTVEGLAALEDSFNNCLEALLRYCNLRQRLVNRMFPDIRLRSLSDAQEKVIRRGRLALLQMRRVADAHRLAMNPMLKSNSEAALKTNSTKTANEHEKEHE